MDKAKLAHEEEGWIALLPFFLKWALLSENNPKFMDKGLTKILANLYTENLLRIC